MVSEHGSAAMGIDVILPWEKKKLVLSLPGDPRDDN
jgi:hypothetical protein